jgi:hypothetical protein
MVFVLMVGIRTVSMARKEWWPKEKLCFNNKLILLRSGFGGHFGTVVFLIGQGFLGH